MYIEPVSGASSSDNHLLGDDESYPVVQIDSKEFSRRLNQKISGLALSKIPSSNYEVIFGHHAAVAASPQVVLNILPKDFNFNIFDKKKKRENVYLTNSLKEQKRLAEKYQGLKSEKKNEENVPIGISSNLNCSWINALLQFIIFNTSLKLMFNYTPKSFSSFNDFIDIYLYDQEKKKPVTTAVTLPVVETLSKYFNGSVYFENAVIDLFGILNGIMNYVFPVESVNLSEKKRDGDLLAIFPNARISIENEEVDLQEFISKNFINQGNKKIILPGELLINFRWFLKNPVSKINKCPLLFYLFDELFLSTQYELDSFVEFRPDDFHISGHYLTYVKLDSLWFQCDDSRIRQIRSNNLPIALSRSFLFHYKKIKFSKNDQKLV